MNLNRALNILAKFFQVNTDVFQKGIKDGAFSKEDIIAWGTQVQTEALPFREAPGHYRLTRQQHSFLTGDTI